LLASRVSRNLQRSVPSLSLPTSRLFAWLSAGAVAVSGFAGLGYQIVWTQQFSVWLGHEIVALLAVVAAFFGGLAVGSLALGQYIEASRRPARWYAGCEVLIAVWSLALALLIEPLNTGLLVLTGPQPTPAWQWLVAFIGTFVALLPATAAMGATLPAMERVYAGLRGSAQAIGALYAANTLGAVFGVLAAAFFLVPQLGLAKTAMCCAALNLVCAGVVLGLARHVPSVPSRAPAGARGWGVPARLLATGALGIGYEVVVVRALSQVAEDTVYTFAMLLAVYLVGTAGGAAAYQRWLSARADDAASSERLRDRLLAALAVACLLGTTSLWASADLKTALQHLLGASFASALWAEVAIALAAFGLPTVVMGALFSHLCVQARMAGSSFGQALGINTLGAAFAPLLFGLLLLPTLGPQLLLLAISAAYLLLIPLRRWPTPAVWAPALAAAGLAALAPPLAFVPVPEGGKLLSHSDGVMAAVSVVEDAGGVRRLHIDNHVQEGSSASGVADSRQALLPMLLHPDPKRALFLGLGTGVTAAAAADDRSLQVDAVELLPEVVAASAYFAAPGGASPEHPRPNVMVADARRYVRSTSQRYDLIVSDLFHPARSGAGALYTVEHFQAVRERLAPGGVFCQWLPLHQLDLDTLRSIVQSFVTVYPGGFAMLATHSLDTPVIGLVARPGATRFDLQQLRARLAGSTLAGRARAIGLGDEFAVFGSFIAGPQALARFAGRESANTDDRPVVVYRAPRITYAPDSLPRDRLIALLHQLAMTPDELLAPATDAAWMQRLTVYWSARTAFIEAGRQVRPTADAAAMLAQVRSPLMHVVRTSPDFRPAYDPLLRMALALAASDPAGAQGLLAELMQAQPARPEAAAALARLRALNPDTPPPREIP